MGKLVIADFRLQNGEGEVAAATKDGRRKEGPTSEPHGSEAANGGLSPALRFGDATRMPLRLGMSEGRAKDDQIQLMDTI